MLRLFPARTGDCQRSTRRTFLLEIGSLAGLGVTLPGLLRAQSARGASSGRDVSCILIWTLGGTSHHDTLDPKPEASPDVRGEFGVVQTKVPGVVFSEHLPRMAEHLPLFAVLRGLNPKNGSHGVADAYMMSGHRFNPTVTYPCYGSVVAYEKGYRNNLPPFIQIGPWVDRRFNGGTAGYLGIAYNPFEVVGDPNNPNFTVRDLVPPRGVSMERLSRRRQALAMLDRLQRDLEKPSPEFRVLDEYHQRAFAMVTSPSTKKAFDLSAEDPRVRDRYGRNRFGQSCLLARRLIEAGVRFVTVTSPGWDTHTNNFRALKSKLPPFDQAFTALLTDLHSRGLLETTLVLWLTDFGRTPKINSAAGRDHWSTAAFAVFAGAGVPGGQVIGKTDAEGARVVEDEYHPEDIAATVYSKLGIPLDTIHMTPDGRPMKLCEGSPIPPLMG